MPQIVPKAAEAPFARQSEENAAKADLSNPLIPPGWDESSKDMTQIVGITCDVDLRNTGGPMEKLRRVIVVNYFGGVVLDRAIEGSSGQKKARPYVDVQKELHELLKDKIVVGHNLEATLKLLMLELGFSFRRDTTAYAPLQRAHGRPHKLKDLGIEVLGMKESDWSSHADEDDGTSLYRKYKAELASTAEATQERLLRAARVPLLIYRHIQSNWEAYIMEHTKSPGVQAKLKKNLGMTRRATKKHAQRMPALIQVSNKKGTKAAPKQADSDSESDSWASSEHSDKDNSDDSDDSDSFEDESDYSSSEE